MRPEGPKPTTRHVLLALSLRMKNDTLSCFPSVDCLAEDTGLGRNAIRKHIKLAVDAKLIDVLPRQTESGRDQSHLYIARLPEEGSYQSRRGSPQDPITSK